MEGGRGKSFPKSAKITLADKRGNLPQTGKIKIKSEISIKYRDLLVSSGQTVNIGGAGEGCRRLPTKHGDQRDEGI